MTRKDYEYIALILNHQYYLSAWCMDNDEDRRSIAEHFAFYLANDNPKFNKDKFVSACMDNVHITCEA